MNAPTTAPPAAPFRHSHPYSLTFFHTSAAWLQNMCVFQHGSSRICFATAYTSPAASFTENSPLGSTRFAGLALAYA